MGRVARDARGEELAGGLDVSAVQLQHAVSLVQRSVTRAVLDAALKQRRRRLVVALASLRHCPSLPRLGMPAVRRSALSKEVPGVGDVAALHLGQRCSEKQDTAGRIPAQALSENQRRCRRIRRKNAGRGASWLLPLLRTEVAHAKRVIAEMGGFHREGDPQAHGDPGFPESTRSLHIPVGSLQIPSSVIQGHHAPLHARSEAGRVDGPRAGDVPVPRLHDRVGVVQRPMVRVVVDPFLEEPSHRLEGGGCPVLVEFYGCLVDVVERALLRCAEQSNLGRVNRF
mmetsp:Transcript_6890/g.26607  ORF Transcript_6890/g.26607 Transcript_6890/m.26607 type:complete len:284 (+) Transcript_6890:686-1537(+)